VFLCAALALPLGLTAQAPPTFVSASLPETPLPQPAVASTDTQDAGQSSASGQSSSTAPPPPPQAQTADDKRAQSQREIEAEEKQRMLGIMPEFNVVNSGNAAPIDSREKFSLWFHSAIDPFTIGIAGVDAGIEQADNTYPTWHQGLKGYAKRFGSSYADNVDGNFWGNAVLPSLLHQDPRYFRKGEGSIGSRIFYSAISTVRCKGDNGRWQPNYSNVAGNLIGGGISNFYYPSDNRGIGLTFERGLTVTAEGALGAFAEEFYPDFIKLLHRHKKQ
jgi:hypothetical protein